MTPKDWNEIKGMIKASEAEILAKLGEGVAQQETSQEILENIKDLNPSVDGKIAKTTGAISFKNIATCTVLDITGKGTFIGCVFWHGSLPKNKTAKLIVEIDGVEYVMGLTNNSDSTSDGDCRICIFDPKDMYAYALSSANRYYGYRGVIATTTGGELISANVGEIVSISGYRDNILISLESPLIFKQSLKVSVVIAAYGQNTNSTTVWYTLDE